MHFVLSFIHYCLITNGQIYYSWPIIANTLSFWQYNKYKVDKTNRKRTEAKYKWIYLKKILLIMQKIAYSDFESYCNF